MKIVAILTATGLAAASFLVFAGAEGHGGHGRGGERLKAADTNGDGMISRAESAALPRIAQHFDQIDANRDGQVTKDELRAFHQQHHGDHRGDRKGGLKRADTDGDGRISKAEAQANAPRLFEHFDAIDANRDGFVTREEMKAARKAHHAQSTK